MSVLVQRLDIDYRLIWDGGWHVGSGFGTAAVDRLVRRRPDGTPFVPGSQIKGVLRHHCERLAASLDCAVVPPHALEESPAELVRNFRPLQASGLLIDRLFGSRFEGGCLFVEDAVPEGEQGEGQKRQHSRTAIDRVSGTARDRTLFVTEVVIGAGRTFRGRISGRHPAAVLTQLDQEFPCEYALLVAGLLTLDSLGGEKSTGLGGCRVSLGGGLKWNGKPLSLEQALAGFENDDWQTVLSLLPREGDR